MESSSVEGGLLSREIAAFVVALVVKGTYYGSYCMNCRGNKPDSLLIVLGFTGLAHVNK